MHPNYFSLTSQNNATTFMQSAMSLGAILEDEKEPSAFAGHRSVYTDSTIRSIGEKMEQTRGHAMLSTMENGLSR